MNSLDTLLRHIHLLADPGLDAANRQDIHRRALDAVAELRHEMRGPCDSTAQRDEPTWRARMEAVAEALQDVAPGELGRMDVVGRIARLRAQFKRTGRDEVGAEHTALQATANRKPSWQDDEATIRTAIVSLGDPRDYDLRAPSLADLTRLAAGAQEVEALRAKVMALEVRHDREMQARGALIARLNAAESRLATIRDPLVRMNKARMEMQGWDAQEDAGSGLRGAGEDAFFEWGRALKEALSLLEGDAPQDASTTRGGTVDPTIGLLEPVSKVTIRYPCSATCTHDDAATPGHLERVKERSEAVRRVAVPTPIAVGALVSERSVAIEADPSLSVTEAACYEQGAEAMRAACREAVHEVLRKSGIHRTDMLWDSLTTAVEGATP